MEWYISSGHTTNLSAFGSSKLVIEIAKATVRSNLLFSSSSILGGAIAEYDGRSRKSSTLIRVISREGGGGMGMGAGSLSGV